MNKHEHLECLHSNLKYCTKCDVVYCVDCDKEWGNSTCWDSGTVTVSCPPCTTVDYGITCDPYQTWCGNGTTSNFTNSLKHMHL